MEMVTGLCAAEVGSILPNFRLLNQGQEGNPHGLSFDLCIPVMYSKFMQTNLWPWYYIYIPWKSKDYFLNGFS